MKMSGVLHNFEVFPSDVDNVGTKKDLRLAAHVAHAEELKSRIK